MTTNEFLEKLEDILLTDEKLSVDSKLDDFDEWDSLFIMSVMTLFKQEFDLYIPVKQILSAKTPKELIKLVDGKII